MDRPKALLSWSSGKDSAWTLQVLRERAAVEVVGLVTTIHAEAQRVAMHGVRLELLQAQAEAVGLPLWVVPLPWPCSNALYEERFRAVCERARAEGIHRMAFGDLYLQDIREYRGRLLRGTGLQPEFPLWMSPEQTQALAEQMLVAGLQATLTCVDPRQLSASFVGRTFDATLLAELPEGVDPCGERGEFHTFCQAGPMFRQPIAVRLGETVEREGFWFVDLLLEH